MKTIRKIFLTDLKNLSRNLFALIIAVGICFLPALYAWCNIYSNWDPYGNTGALKLAAVSLDKGYTNQDGEYKNVGSQIMDNLADNDKVNWQFVDSQEDAIEGVNSGAYYAAVVIDENFAYNMYNVFTTDFEKPMLVFYENQKKNPVATKISDTVVSTLENNINEEFIKVMTKTVFSEANDVSDDLKDEGGIDGLIDKLTQVNNELIEYEDVIDSVISGNAVLTRNITSADADVKDMTDKTSSSAQSLQDAQGSMANTQITFNTYSNEVNTTLDTMKTTLSNISTEIQQAKMSEDIAAMTSATSEAYKDTQQLLTDVNALNESLAATGEHSDIVSSALGTLGNMKDEIQELQKVLGTIDPDKVSSDISQNAATQEQNIIEALSRCESQVNDLQNQYNNNLVPQVNNTLDSLENVLSNAGDLMKSMSQTLANMGNVFGALQTTVSLGNTSLEKTRDALRAISDKLTEAINKVNEANDDEKVQALIDTLSGNPELYGEFFSEPVEIETVAVYPIANYGSAVTPFYTVLAIWVGGIILTAIIKVKPTKSKYPDAKPYELFFGRYAIFFVLAQIQTLVTVLGDLYLLGVQCIHPGFFWLASAEASLVFSLLIYALVYAFGDVGKAASVVIVVLQIAGSSGTYPIELLPEFFQKVYIFFPFPYAINAMRECICGMYEADYVIYLLQLSLFIIVSLVIGIWIQKPFEELNHFMEKRMEDTEIM